MAQTLRSFDAAAQTWDENPARLELNRRIAQAIAREVPLRADMQVLDFGCGTGLLTMALSSAVGKVVAVDTSAGMLEVLEEKLRRAAVSNVDTLKVDLTGGDSIALSFDLVVSGMTLHHIPDPTDLLSRLTDRLRPGGHLCIADLDTEDGSFHPDPTGVFHAGFSAETMRAMFEACGLHQTRTVAIHTIKRLSADGTPRTYSVLLTVGLKP